MRLMHTMVAAATVVGAAGTAQAVTYTLTFDANVACGTTVCANYSPIDQGYGDTALVDISYQSVFNPGESSWAADLFYWDNGYGDLQDVAWGGFSNISGAAQIILKAAPGYKVTLVSLDVAGWPNTDRGSFSTLYDLNYTVLGVTGAFTAPGTGHFGLTCAAPLCTNSGLVLEWGPDAYDVGVDNVTFDVTRTSVPEPSAWALMIGGFGLVGSTLRRRRYATA